MRYSREKSVAKGFQTFAVRRYDKILYFIYLLKSVELWSD
jgi:hypothetical protein